MSDIKWSEHPQWYSDAIREAHEQQCPESTLIYERMAHLQQRIRELESALRGMLEIPYIRGERKVLNKGIGTHTVTGQAIQQAVETLEPPR